MKIGFVGLGVMGAPMAGHLLTSGASLTVWSRTAGRDQALVDSGAHRASDLFEMGAECDIVFLCVNRSEDVAQCLEQLSTRAKPGTLFVDHSTIAPAAATRFHAKLAESGFRFVDAPITGGSRGAQAGQLTIFCGGGEAEVAEAIVAMKPYAARAERVGGPGAGQLMKMANQIAVGGALVALCEAMSFASKAGLDLAQTRELLSRGAAGSWAFEHYGPKILERDWSPGFRIRDQRKDFGYCVAAAEQVDAPVPCTQLVDELLARIEAEGHGERTTAALFELMVRSGFSP